jgi:hypothetical protein
MGGTLNQSGDDERRAGSERRRWAGSTRGQRSIGREEVTGSIGLAHRRLVGVVHLMDH